MIGKNLFGFVVNCKDDLTLSLPDRMSYKQLRSKFVYQNKDFFWNAIKPVVEYMSDFKSVIWNGDPDLAIEAHTATRAIRDKKSEALKDTLIDFYCLFFGNDANIFLIAESTLSEEGKELARLLVKEGACCIAEIPDLLSWPPYKPNHWGNNIDNITFQRWSESKETYALAMMSFVLNGPAPQLREKTRQTSYVPNYPYILPDYRMIQYVLGNDLPPIAPVDIPDPASLNLFLFQGDDFFGNEETLQSLILSGIVAPGKTKIGVSVAKKVNSFIPLKPFPLTARPVMTRAEYITHAALLTFGEPTDMELPQKKLSDKKFLKEMYEIVKLNNRYFFLTILSERVKGVVQEFFSAKKRHLEILTTSISATLIDGYNALASGWIDIETFTRVVNYRMSLAKYGYLYPDHYSQRPDSMKTLGGWALGVDDFKSHFHDHILRALIEGMASLGAIDLLYDKDGYVRFLRLSEAGKWYEGISNEMPRSKLLEEVESSIDVDDRTGLITVKNPNYPYANLLSEFAEKMTDSRYCFSEKAFLKKCDTPEMLDAKIKRFQMFILLAPGPNIQRRIDKMKADCNLVTKTAGGSTFQLFDIDPKNSRLHNVIVDNKEIKMNTLKVEGCKLLVKSKFIPRFFEILSDNGFLNEANG